MMITTRESYTLVLLTGKNENMAQFFAVMNDLCKKRKYQPYWYQNRFLFFLFSLQSDYTVSFLSG